MKQPGQAPGFCVALSQSSSSTSFCLKLLIFGLNPFTPDQQMDAIRDSSHVTRPESGARDSLYSNQEGGHPEAEKC
jgi:hypothetical protein